MRDSIVVRMAVAMITLIVVSSCGGSTSMAPVSYTVGGTILGLTAPGLVLANGNDTVSPAAGATSFTFAMALASGSNYAVTVSTQPAKGTCQVSNGSGQVPSAAVTSVVVTCTRDWTWMSGSSTVGSRGVYGTAGVAAAGNVPGARGSSVSWIDGAGDLWLFSGFGFDSTGRMGDLNDMWRYVPASGQWTWVGGASAVAVRGVYGTQGMAAPGNVPGARDGAVSWFDSAGNLWVFGGYGYDSAGSGGDLNDLWRYDPVTGLWTWIGGSNTAAAGGVYGTQGMAAAGNVPGARAYSVSWTDSAGDLWLFGGSGYDSAGASGLLNDLWQYSPASGQWTWVSGSSTINAAGVYGTQGMAAAANTPGARSYSVSWTDTAGDLWLFGGSLDLQRYFNDLWRFSPSMGQWTWVGGSNTYNAMGVYGSVGMAASGNGPGGRCCSVSWTDSSAGLWLFGGAGFTTSMVARGGFSDLWRYDVSGGLWSWQSGSNQLNVSGVYGSLGQAAASNAPGARSISVTWTDSAGSLWLFGGQGLDSAGRYGYLNDLWVY